VDDALPARRELVDQLAGLVETRLVDPLEILLESVAELAAVRERVLVQAEVWAARLLGTDEVTARYTAIRLVSTLYPGDGGFAPPAGWWQTPLGRVLALRVGHPVAESVSYAVAGEMLGITRQGVHDLITRGKLDRHPDKGVSTASVQRRIRSTLSQKKQGEVPR